MSVIKVGFGPGIDNISPSGGGGSAEVADLSDWDSKPDGTSDGAYGLGPNDRVFRWKSSISQWVPSELHPYTFTQRGATLGAEAIPTGWTRNLGTNATSSSDGTVFTIDTSSSVSLQDRIAITTPPLATSAVYVVGYFWIDSITSAGSGVGASASIFHDNNSKRRLIGPSTTGAAMRFSTSNGSAKVGSSSETTQATRTWFEYFAAEPSGNAMIRQAHAPQVNALVDYNQNSNISGNAFQIGDSSTSVSAASHYEDFRVYELTI